MSFFNELNRRNVFRVGIGYAVAAWVLLQVVDLVLENIIAPDWVMKVFMLVVAVGFPVAIIIAWAFEMTPEGLKRESEVDRSQSITQSTGTKLDKIIIGFLALAVVFLVLNPFESKNEPNPTVAVTTETITDTVDQAPAVRDKSVAVLPFAFRSANEEDAFFAEGMHDDLLTQLAKIGSLKVISRTSVMEYKNTTKKIPQIAKELGVATIVEGGVQRSGSRIRINAQLIDAETDEHLWAETYDRELTAENLFDIQAEIARAIAQALKATLSPEEEASIERVLTTNLEAWESYQRAVRLRQGQTTESISGGIFEVNRTLQLDPEFAAAWSLKAILLMMQYWFYDTDVATRDTAWDAIQRGRAIDPSLAELDIAEGYYHYWGFRDYKKALPFMQRASVKLPNNARVHMAHAYVLRRMGEWKAALDAMQHASELDPRNNQPIVDIGATLSSLRRFEEARVQFSRAHEIAPDSAESMWLVAALQFNESGDVSNYSHLNHLMVPPNPPAQRDRWRSSLLMDDYDAAIEDVVYWPERFLITKDWYLTKSLLTGLTHHFFGNDQAALPMLIEAKQDLEIRLKNNPNNYAVSRSMCLIMGALANLDAANLHCSKFLETVPKDAFISGGFKFDAAAGLALAGNAKASIELIRAILDGDAGPTIYMVIYHPAFDGIREDPEYIELLEEYGPENKQP